MLILICYIKARDLLQRIKMHPCALTFCTCLLPRALISSKRSSALGTFFSGTSFVTAASCCALSWLCAWTSFTAVALCAGCLLGCGAGTFLLLDNCKKFEFSVALCLQRLYRLSGTGSPGWSPQLSHSSWPLKLSISMLLYVHRDLKDY